VVSSSGRIGGFQGKTSGAAVRKKIDMLKAEGIRFSGDRIINLQDILFRF